MRPKVGLKFITNIFQVSENSLERISAQRGFFRVSGELWFVRFLRVSAPCYPAEVFKFHRVGNTLRVSLTHMFALKGSLSQWLKEKGPTRSVGIKVLTPERKIAEVLEIRNGEAQLSDGSRWSLDSLRPFLAWEELSSSLRKRTLTYRSLTPKEVLRKIWALVENLFGDKVKPVGELDLGTLWRPKNLVFGSGLRGSYMSEIFLGLKPFYKPPESLPVTFLLPKDPENRVYGDYFYQLVQKSSERLGELGLRLEDFSRVYYDPADEESLRKAVAQLSDSRFVLGIVVPPKLWTQWDPYFYTKAALWEARVPSQMVKISTLKKFMDKYGFSEGIWADELWQGIWVNVVLKAGGVPWIVAETGAQGEVEGLAWNDEGAARVLFTENAQVIRWTLEKGEPKAQARVAHVSEPKAVAPIVISVEPSEVQVAPGDHRTKLLSGFWLRDPEEPSVFHVATESWDSYREFNLYKVRVVSGSVEPERAASQVFWFARAYLSTFPKGPYPISIHFPRLILKGLEHGIFGWGDGGEIPYFI